MATPANYFEYTSPPKDGTVKITGLSDAGKCAGVLDIVFPPTDDANPPNRIVGINLNAFRVGSGFTGNSNNQIRSVDFKGSLITTIEGGAFHTASNLITAEFNEGLDTIGNAAFKGTNLQKVLLSSTITSLGLQAFIDNPRLNSVDTSKVTGNLAIDSNVFDGSTNTITVRFNRENSNQALAGGLAPTANFKSQFPQGTLFEPYCFLEGTLILTPSGYKPVESLKKGDLVRTLKGDKPVGNILTQTIPHDASEERNAKQLFSLHYPSVFQPLIVTGGHSTLVTPTPKEFEAITTIFKVPEPVDGFYRLPAYVDEKASVYEVSGDYKVYHIVIGTTFEGIFANGLLVESCVIY
jgi:hypothetical protein